MMLGLRNKKWMCRRLISYFAYLVPRSQAGSLLFMKLSKSISHFGDYENNINTWAPSVFSSRPDFVTETVHDQISASKWLTLECSCLGLCHLRDLSISLKFQNFKYYIVSCISLDFVSWDQVLSFQLSLLGLLISIEKRDEAIYLFSIGT